MALEWLFLLIGGTFGCSLTAIGVMMYRTFVLRAWPIRVPILRQRGDMVVWKLNQRARKKISKDGFEVLQLRKVKNPIKPPKSSELGVDEKGRPVYPIYVTSTANFPIKIDNPKKFEVQMDKSARNWAILELRHGREKYAPQISSFMQMLPFLMSGTFAAMVIFFTI